MIKYTFFSLFLLSATFVSSVMAQAQPAGQIPAANVQGTTQNKPIKTEEHGDWVLVCRKAEAQSAQTCELVQTIANNREQAPFAQIAIGKPKADMPIQITVVVPNNVSFPSSVKIVTDEKDRSPLDIAWTRCMPVGCFASTALKDDIQKKWSGLEAQGRAIFKAGNGQDIAMPISFKGLKGALEALGNER